MKYICLEHALNCDEVLFCYTDGITEAQNLSGAEFGEERCIEVVTQLDMSPLPDLLEGVRQEVARFSDMKLLDDDCTMLALRRRS
jgi:sigma-B regulation protein RsbU (phosphoserine phosphatase)